MKTVGILCEYNPFHNGHQKQIAWIRGQFGEDAAIVCLMSGDYVQRGEPAVFDKALRAEAALRAGADLVLELPILQALSSAEGFADGGVEILEQLGVDDLCFGAENAEIEALLSTAALLLREEFSEYLREMLTQKISFAAARQRAVEALGGDGTLLEKPNNILGVEYCKAILRRGARIRPVVLRRDGDYHAQTPELKNPSASALRAGMDSPDWLRYTPAAALFRDARRHTLKIGERAVLARLFAMSDAEFAALPFGAEGLWSAFRKACRTQGAVEDILSAAKSKRYARARLQRMLLCAFLGITQEDLQGKAPYVRVLGFSDCGRKALSRMHRESALPLLHAGQRAPQCRYRELEERAARLYPLFAETALRPEREQVISISRRAERS